jgi:hypothetical protein
MQRDRLWFFLSLAWLGLLALGLPAIWFRTEIAVRREHHRLRGLLARTFRLVGFFGSRSTRSGTTSRQSRGCRRRSPRSVECRELIMQLADVVGPHGLAMGPRKSLAFGNPLTPRGMR